MSVELYLTYLAACVVLVADEAGERPLAGAATGESEYAPPPPSRTPIRPGILHPCG
jgi:hypothetical protein